MLRIEIAKKADGRGVLRCVREDGSSTWQKQTVRTAAFFALHDLTHLAVESALNCRNAFFGLIEQGWEIDDTTGKGARGPLPPEAVEIERIVGALDLERASNTLWTAEEFNEYATGLALTANQLQRVRALRARFTRLWLETAPNETLRLQFPFAD